jgi:acyl carrier protein
VDANIKPSTTADRVQSVIAWQLGAHPDDVKPESRLADDLGADSLDKVELVTALEDEFDIDLDDDAHETIQTVQQAIDYVTGLVPAA